MSAVWEPNAEGHSRPGSVNWWICNVCGGDTYVIHVDGGVTPMVLACRATPGCEGYGTSAWYRDDELTSEQAARIGLEWFRPPDIEVSTWTNDEARAHIEQGGLILRPITDVGRALIPEGMRP